MVNFSFSEDFSTSETGLVSARLPDPFCGFKKGAVITLTHEDQERYEEWVALNHFHMENKIQLAKSYRNKATDSFTFAWHNETVQRLTDQQSNIVYPSFKEGDRITYNGKFIKL